MTADDSAVPDTEAARAYTRDLFDSQAYGSMGEEIENAWLAGHRAALARDVPAGEPPVRREGAYLSKVVPADSSPLERGFYRLARDLNVGPDTVSAGSLIFLASVERNGTHGAVHGVSALARTSLAALTAAGAVRVEGE